MAQNQRGDGVAVEGSVAVALAAASVSVGGVVAVGISLGAMLAVWVEVVWDVAGAAAGVPQALNKTVMMNREAKLLRILFPLG
jgi:predicted alpha/beta-fold hydrolase